MKYTFHFPRITVHMYQKKQLGLKYRNTVHRIFLHIIYIKNRTMVNYSDKWKKKFDSVVYWILFDKIKLS